MVVLAIFFQSMERKTRQHVDNVYEYVLSSSNFLFLNFLPRPAGGWGVVYNGLLILRVWNVEIMVVNLLGT